jgi:hypothetical protein
MNQLSAISTSHSEDAESKTEELTKDELRTKRISFFSDKINKS